MSPLHAHAPLDADLFRAAMRQLAAGVCLVTTADATGRRNGLTATAVSSVSAEPPLLLVCVNQAASTYADIRASGRFVVNVLETADQALADRFAGGASGEARFDQGEWTHASTGAPLLASARVAFDCELAEVADMGSHGVFFGRVVAIRLSDRGDGLLLYAQGSYGTFTPSVP